MPRCVLDFSTNENLCSQDLSYIESDIHTYVLSTEQFLRDLWQLRYSRNTSSIYFQVFSDLNSLKIIKAREFLIDNNWIFRCVSTSILHKITHNSLTHGHLAHFEILQSPVSFNLPYDLHWSCMVPHGPLLSSMVLYDPPWTL